MESQTLEELKQENADAEAQQSEKDVEIETEAAAETNDDSFQDQAIENEYDAENEIIDEKPSWLSEDSDSQEDRRFTGSDIAAAKRKLKGRLEEKSSEVEELKDQVAQLMQQQQSQASQAQALNRPTREQFLNAEDPDEAYIDAMTDWKLASKIQQSQGVVQQHQRQQVIEQAQNRHYEAASKLIDEHGISPDLYKQADTQFRRGLDSVRQGAGDLIAQELITQMGEGSEKVTYMLGRNPSKMAQLQQALMEDPSGIKASMMMGRLQAEVTMPRKNTRKAPPPARRVQGDASSTGNSAKRMKKAYDQAGNAQDAFNARRAAKKAGVDTSNW